MGIKFEMSVKDLNDLQMHMVRLLEYYEAEIAALGCIEQHITGDALEYLRACTQQRIEQLNSADCICRYLMQK